MGALFETPKTPTPPQEDPSIKAARDAEATRAEQERTRATQDQLRLETSQRNTGLGTRSLLGLFGGTGGRGLTSLLGSG